MNRGSDKKRLNAFVKPNSKKNEITEFDEKRRIIKVSIKAPAENNRANKELVKFLSKKFNGETRIIAGISSKNKLIEITTK